VKELRRNMRIIGNVVVFLFAGLCIWYALTVYTQGAKWAASSYNTRNTVKISTRGDITDRNGITLATNDENGRRVYLENEQARRALSQTVGDTMGMTGASVECFNADKLMNISDSLTGGISALFSGNSTIGNSLKLTIDAKLQAYVSSIFPKGYSGAVCIINYKTGEILCMASLPNFDPQALIDGEISASDVIDTAFLNRCLQGLYTPGSTFKIVTLAAALEADPNCVNQSFTCAGIWEFGSYKVNCASNNEHGTVNLKKAFAKSCNVTFGKLSYQLGAERLRAAAEKFGFNVNFKFGDFAVYNSKFPTEMKNDAELVWSGVGQGEVLVTPLHMAMISGCIANGGTMMKPYLLCEERAANGILQKSGASEVYSQVITADNANIIATYMYEAVKSGTAKQGAISGYTVCGKTGSAEVSNNKEIETNAWYTGFVYDDNHPYAISVVIENGGAGGSEAAPIAAKALAKAIEYND